MEPERACVPLRRPLLERRPPSLSLGRCTPPTFCLTLARAWRQVLGLALAMQACVRAVGGTVQLRVGVAMGAVVAGVMGAQQQRYHFFGEALDAAERLQQQCRPGDILVHARVASTAAAVNADAAELRADAGGFRFAPAAAVGGRASGGEDVLLLDGSLEAEPGLGQHSPDCCCGGVDLGGGGKGGRGGGRVGGGLGCRMTAEAATTTGDIEQWPSYPTAGAEEC
jgi:hypothetical protein